jgi:hypothetical protein
MGFEDLVARFDCYPAAEAVARAWQPIDPRRFGTWHRSAREEVAYLMPLLARALDRLLAELDGVMPSTDWDLWAEIHPSDTVRVDRIRPKVRTPR